MRKLKKYIHQVLIYIKLIVRESFARSGHNPVEANITRSFVFPTAIGPLDANLVVIAGEGNRPHFHISISGAFFTSIRLDKPKYYFHKESYRYLTNDQRYALIQFLKSDPYAGITTRNPSMRERTVWEWLVTMWKMDCRNIDRGICWDAVRVPDYFKLKTKPYVKWRHDNRRSFIHIL